VEDGSTPLEITHTNSVVCDTHEPEITGTTGTGGTGSGGSGI
jgi:hypothetical protein